MSAPTTTRRTRPKAEIPDALRAEVLGARRCRYCMDLLGPFEVDHVRPLSRGGTNDSSNLVCACVSCNTQKSNLLLHEWRQWRTANGMFWPPVAGHATDPIHYRDGCRKCLDAGRPNWRVTPYRLDDVEQRGYRALYRCPSDGSQWQCFHGDLVGYFSDCECPYCVACRLEDDW